jgi:hypothetical protein
MVEGQPIFEGSETNIDVLCYHAMCLTYLHFGIFATTFVRQWNYEGLTNLPKITAFLAIFIFKLLSSDSQPLILPSYLTAATIQSIFSGARKLNMEGGVCIPLK